MQWIERIWWWIPKGQGFLQIDGSACLRDLWAIRSWNYDLSSLADLCQQGLGSDQRGFEDWSPEVKNLTRSTVLLVFTISRPFKVELAICLCLQTFINGIYLSSIFASTISFRSCFNFLEHQVSSSVFFYLYAFSSTCKFPLSYFFFFLLRLCRVVNFLCPQNPWEEICILREESEEIWPRKTWKSCTFLGSWPRSVGSTTPPWIRENGVCLSGLLVGPPIDSTNLTLFIFAL